MAPGSVWKSSQERTLGGHAMVLVGYDDHRHAFKVLNSRGRIWGDGGYGWIDFDFFRKVVDEAFVAKDAINGPPPAANASAATAQPQPAPAAYELVFRITNIQHNVPGAGGGLWLRLDGTVSVPPGMGRSGQIVTYFSYDAGGGQKGWPVRSTSMQFSDINGMAATGTTTFSIPAEGVNLGWWAMIPYTALALQPGGWILDASGNQVYQPWENHLILEPVLLIDGFGVANGGMSPFVVLQ